MNDYVKKNMETISSWICDGWTWGKPISKSEFERAKKGDYSLLLTPKKPVPKSWIGDVKDKEVLGFASGGGQQVPILAALGAKVSLLDLNESQVKADIDYAKREKYDIEIYQNDYNEPFPIPNDKFDMIFAPVSLVYAETLDPIFKELYRVLKPGGRLLIGFDNGINFITNDEITIENSLPFNPLRNKNQQKSLEKDDAGYQFSHTLGETLGGLLRVGFVLKDIYEDVNEYGRLADLGIPSYYSVYLIK